MDGADRFFLVMLLLIFALIALGLGLALFGT